MPKKPRPRSEGIGRMKAKEELTIRKMIKKYESQARKRGTARKRLKDKLEDRKGRRYDNKFGGGRSI